MVGAVLSESTELIVKSQPNLYQLLKPALAVFGPVTVTTILLPPSTPVIIPEAHTWAASLFVFS